jgi:NADP-dependent 3-hydroxy acid dehydrogenase YdfG
VQYDEMLNVNLRGPYFMTAEVERRMIERGKGGRVLNISSAIGIKPTVGLSAYCAISSRGRWRWNGPRTRSTSTRFVLDIS